MKQKTILIVQGGTSSEREVSLSSSKACTKALKKLKYKVIMFDPAKEHLSKIKKYKKQVNLVFNALHGVESHSKHVLFSFLIALHRTDA